MSDHDLRDKLLDRAKYGEITGAEADAEAIRLGLGSLSSTPGPEAFRPEAETHWTLPMAVAWIAYRDLDEVREWSAAYRAHCWDWRWQRWRNGPGGEVHEGWTLQQRSFPSLPHIEMSFIVAANEGHAEGALMSIREAREALWIALGEGMLPATGVERRSGTRVDIPPMEWRGMKALDSDHRDEVGRDGVGMDYAELLVFGKGVRLLWSARRERLLLPPLMSPEGDGYMPLYCAARWIASRGGALDFDPEDGEVWRSAFDTLLAAIASEKVRVTGLREGMRDLVPGYRFAGCEVDYPHTEAPADLFFSGRVYLRSYPYLNEEHWRQGFDDALISRQKDHITQLMVERGDVRARWPFGTVQPVSSGAPGRPTSMHLVLGELDARGQEGRLEESVRKQAQVLSIWLKDQHPLHPPLTPKAISNKIGPRYRELLAARK